MTKRSLTELRDHLTESVTDLARLSIEGGGFDVAAVIVDSVAATAANVGGSDAFLSGRPGSWEADLIARLLTSAVGADPHDWRWNRSEPLVVTLNVAELIESDDLHPGLVGLFDANVLLSKHFDALPETDEVVDLYENASSALEAHYKKAYRLYGERFAAAVTLISNQLNLRVSPEVKVDADPYSYWWENTSVRNAPRWEDLLVDDIWERAHDVVALPDVLVAVPRRSATPDRVRQRSTFSITEQGG